MDLLLCLTELFRLRCPQPSLLSYCLSSLVGLFLLSLWVRRCISMNFPFSQKKKKKKQNKKNLCFFLWCVAAKGCESKATAAKLLFLWPSFVFFFVTFFFLVQKEREWEHRIHPFVKFGISFSLGNVSVEF